MAYYSSAFDGAFKAFDVFPDELPEKNVYSIPENLGHGNSPLDDLWYFMARETIRGLARSLFGIELDVLLTYSVATGHNHDQEQDAAMAWMSAGSSMPWFEEGAVTEAGAGVIDQTAETDVLWLPLSVPNGTALAYFKLRVGTQAANDIAFVRCRLYLTSGMNSLAVAETAFYKLESQDGGLSPMNDQYIEFSPISTSSLTVSNNIRQGWLRISGLVALAGDLAWVSDVQYALKEGL